MEDTKSWTYVIRVPITNFVNITIKFIKPAERKTFNNDDSIETKLLATLRLDFSYL